MIKIDFSEVYFQVSSSTCYFGERRVRSVIKHLAIGAGGLEFDSRAGQIR